MKKTTNSIKKNFIVLLSTLGCLLIADTLFAGEPGGQAPENIDNRYDAPTTAATTSAQATTGSGTTVNRAAKEVAPALQDNAITADPVTGLFQDSTEKKAPSGSASAPAEKSRGVRIVFGSDLVSSYIWRGFYNAGASIQPTLGMSAGNFSLTVWGSKEISDLHKEIDITAAYSFGRVSVSVADYWWEGDKFWEKEDNSSAKYFNLDNHDTKHRLEAGISWTISERFPLSVAWNTMFWGADKDARDGKQNYSSYVELNYPFTVRQINLTATLGFTPYESRNMYGTGGFDVCNIALSAAKEIRISKRFSLPVFSRVILNPAAQDAHVVFGFTLQ